MKLLLANYRYFVSSGPERYLFNLKEALEKREYQVIPFSIRYSKNQKSQYSDYFLDPIGSPDQIYFREHSKKIATFNKALKRLFFDPQVERRVMELVDFSKPDIAYILKYLRKISPAILVGLKKKGIPIVVRLSDYEMACAEQHFFRDEKPCIECLQKSSWQSVKYKCVQNSYAISLINFLATKYHHYKKYFSLINTFIVSNEFMYQKMVQAGIPKGKMEIIHTFTESVCHDTFKRNSTPLITYLGRLERQKGLHVLIDALGIIKDTAPQVHIQVNIIGTGSPSYQEFIFSKVKKYGLIDRITFHGMLNKPEIDMILQRSWCSVLPSLWFENLPNSLLESYANGTPVIASDIGSLPEFIVKDGTGLLFKPGNAKSLSEKILQFVNQNKSDQFKNKVLDFSNKINEEDHVKKLEEVFYRLIKN